MLTIDNLKKRFGFVKAVDNVNLEIWEGEIVYMTLLGGFGIFEGPVIGAMIFTYLKLYAMSNTEYWMFVIGATLIALVLLLPSGVAGAVANLWAKIKKGKVTQGTSC